MQPQDTTKSVARSASHFFTGTFISRFTGMIRDLSMAFFFGTTPAMAAFMVAFRLSNLLRRLFGEGALLNGFIPFFEYKRKEDPVEGAKFFRDLFWTLTVILVALIALSEMLLIPLYLSGNCLPGANSIILLSIVMLPGLLFICLFGLSIALLECERNFFTPAVAPVAFNIVWVLSIWLFKKYPPEVAMTGISAAIVIAFFVQWAVTVPGTVAYVKEFLSKKQWLSPDLFSHDLKLMISPLTFGVIGVAAMQINSAVDIVMARFVSLEGPAYLSYAHRIQQLPLALFGIAISSAIMPSLTRAIKNEKFDHYHALLKFGFLRTFTFLLPGTLAIFVLGTASVNLLYGRGAFSNLSTLHTTYCLWGYGIGLVPSAFVLLLAPAYYSRRDYWTPMMASLLSVAVNVVLNVAAIFIFNLPTAAISFATSITALFNMWFLLRRLHVRILSTLLKPFFKVFCCSVISAVVVLAIGHFFYHDPTAAMLLGKADLVFPRVFLKQIYHFGSLTLAFGVIFLISAYVFRSREILELFGGLLLGRKNSMKK